MNTHDSVSYYHVCTDGNALQWMFKDDEDFIAGTNRIAICILNTFVEVIAYVLMDNHVHFVLYGNIVQCKDFITKYKLLTGKWIRKKYGLSAHIKHLPTQLILISGEEQLLDTIAYIDRNPTSAGYRYLPNEYPWGTARCIFRNKINYNGAAERIDSFNKHERQQILKTWSDIPGHWRIDSNGMILQEDYINIPKLEKIFKSPVRYLYHLSKKLEGKVEMEQGTLSFINDKELRLITLRISEELFGKKNPESLDFKYKLIIARRLRYDFASTPKQISRMLNIKTEILTKFI